MADSVIRKACDRCHSQKLSCKRIGDQACERCIRLQTECKSSPSLRYKKQQLVLQQQQQQQPSQQQQQKQTQTAQQDNIPAAVEKAQKGRRSPKRRRTGTELSLVQPETVPILAQTREPSAKSHVSAVGPDPLLDLQDFDFNFDQLEFLTVPATDYLSHQGIPGIVDGYSTHSNPQTHSRIPVPATFNTAWANQLGPSSETFSQIPPAAFSDSNSTHTNHIVPSVILSNTASLPCGPRQGSSNKGPRPRNRNRPRQIVLRQFAQSSTPGQEASTAHWMAQLSDINTRLLELASALPQTSQYGDANRSRAPEEKVKPHGFPIDEMFKLTRRVSEIVERCSSSSSDEDGPSSRLDNSDPGNSMFVLSTYVRLLDMYQRVFSLVHNELSHTDSGAAFSFWKLPDVTVGSFAVESSPSLQMSLTIQLAEEFLSRLRVSTASLAPAMAKTNGAITNGRSGANGASMFSDVVDVSYRAVKSKEENLGKNLAELRDEIEAFLDS